MSYSHIGDSKKNLEMNKEVYSKRVKLLGEDHPDTLNSLWLLGISYSDIGEYTKSLELA